MGTVTVYLFSSCCHWLESEADNDSFFGDLLTVGLGLLVLFLSGAARGHRG